MTATYCAYRGSLFCGECGDDIKLELAKRGFSPADRAGGSDRYPAGPYECGGPASEADCPQHCDRCEAFLGNRLTDEGYRYLYRALKPGSGGRPDILGQWHRHYVQPIQG